MIRMRDKGYDEFEEKCDLSVEAYEKDSFSVKVTKIGEITITVCEDDCEDLPDD